MDVDDERKMHASILHNLKIYNKQKISKHQTKTILKNIYLKATVMYL